MIQLPVPSITEEMRLLTLWDASAAKHLETKYWEAESREMATSVFWGWVGRARRVLVKGNVERLLRQRSGGGGYLNDRRRCMGGRRAKATCTGWCIIINQTPIWPLLRSRNRPVPATPEAASTCPVSSASPLIPRAIAIFVFLHRFITWVSSLDSKV